MQKTKEEVEARVQKLLKELKPFLPDKSEECLTWAENYIRRKLYLLNGITEEEEESVV